MSQETCRFGLSNKKIIGQHLITDKVVKVYNII